MISVLSVDRTGLYRCGALRCRQDYHIRIYVNGKDIDEPLLCAIDGNSDGDLLDATNKPQFGSDATTPGVDFEYYYLQNRLGNVMGLLDADDSQCMLEYYRYNVFGEATVLPVIDLVDNVTGLPPGDCIEDTPLDLSDNNAQMLIEKASITKFGNVSRFGNVYMYTARRLDEKTGLMYYRERYYEARMGRFVSRDPSGYIDTLSRYCYTLNRPSRANDPYGLYSFDVDDSKCTVTLEFYLQLYFEDGEDSNGNALIWTDAEKQTFAKQAANAIELAWSNKFKIKCQRGYWVKWEAGWFCEAGQKWHKCPCPNGFVTKVDITWGIGGWYLFDDVEATVTKTKTFKTSSAGTSSATLDSLDTTSRGTPGNNRQVPIAHEFGHMIGLDHPNKGAPGVKPNTPAEYNDPAGHPNAGNPSQSIMGNGMQVRSEHMDQWKKAVEEAGVTPRCYPCEAVPR